MFNWVKNIFDSIKNINIKVDEYKSDSIIQSLPVVAYVNKAKGLIEDNDLDGAEVVLRKAVDISEQDSRVYKYLGKIYEKRACFSDAANYYKKSSQINPHDKEVWLRLGMSCLNSEDIEGALNAFEQADKVTPYNTDVYTGWGMALMKQKKYALARDKFLTASKISKYNFTAILLSAVMEVKLHDYDSAEEKLKFLSKVAPNEGSTYEYANLKLLKADYAEAEKFAKKSIEINKQMLPAYIILLEIYSIQKNKIKVEKIFNTALENGLESPILRNALGKAYIRLFEFDKADIEFREALSQDANFELAKIGLALTNSYNGDFTLLDELKKTKAENVYIQEAIGLEELEAGRVEDAIETFKKALRTDSKQTYNYYNLVKAYKLLNDRYNTREYYEKFVRENSDYIEGFVDYSKWLISVEDYADAQRKLRRAEKLEKNNIEVLNLLFLCLYTLVKNNVCEYNIKEAISVARSAQALGKFEYEKELQELENILINIQGNS